MPPSRRNAGLARAAQVARAVALAGVVRRLADRPSHAGLGSAAWEPAPELRSDVSVVVPARDEAGRIGACLDALEESYAGEPIVVDDGSTDQTAAVARRHGALVLPAGSPPRGWAGNAWALDVALRAADRRWVLMLDADVRARPGLVEALVACAERLGATMVSATTTLDSPSAGERFVHPAMLATLVYRFGRPGRLASPARQLANGQCVVVDRRALLACGGFGRWRANLEEDVAMARGLRRAGHTVAFVDGDGLATVEGYGSAVGAWRGWGRSLALAEVTPAANQVLDLTTLAATTVVPPLRMLTGRGDALDALALLVRFGTTAGMRRAYRHRGPAFWLSPVTDPLVWTRLVQTTVVPERTWRGRRYPRR